MWNSLPGIFKRTPGVGTDGMADISHPPTSSDPVNRGVSNDPTPQGANNESTKRSDVRRAAFHKRRRRSQRNRYLTYIDLPDYIFKPFDIRHRNPSNIFDKLTPRQQFQKLSRCEFIDLLVSNIPADSTPKVMYHRHVTAAFVACDTTATWFGKGDGTHPMLDCNCPTSRARTALHILRNMPKNAQQCKDDEVDFMYYDWVLLHLFITKHVRVGHPLSPQKGIVDPLASVHIDPVHDDVMKWLTDCSEQYDRSFDKISEETWHTPYKPSFYVANRKPVPYYDNDKDIFGSIEAPMSYKLSPLDFHDRLTKADDNRSLSNQDAHDHVFNTPLLWRFQDMAVVLILEGIFTPLFPDRPDTLKPYEFTSPFWKWFDPCQYGLIWENRVDVPHYKSIRGDLVQSIAESSLNSLSITLAVHGFFTHDHYSQTQLSQYMKDQGCWRVTGIATKGHDPNHPPSPRMGDELSMLLPASAASGKGDPLNVVKSS